MCVIACLFTRRGASGKRSSEKVVHINYAMPYLTIILKREGVIYLRQLLHKFKSHIDYQYIILKENQIRIQWPILLSMNIPRICTIIE